MTSLNYTSNTQTDSNGKSRTRIEAHDIVSIVSLRHPSQGTMRELTYGFKIIYLFINNVIVTYIFIDPSELASVRW